MHLLSRFLLKFFGVLFVAVGALSGIVGVCWTGTFAWLSLKGEYLNSGDRHAWLGCFGASVAGGLLGWAGAALLRADRVKDAAPDRTFRLTISGQQRRWSPTRGFWGTCLWLGLGAEVFCFSFPSVAAFRVAPVLAGVAIVYLGLHVIFLCHELGHLSAAALLGFDLQRLQVGTGPLLWRARIGDLRVEWRAFLGGALVRTADVREEGWRWRHWLYVAGGPLAHGLACGALAWWWVSQCNHGFWLPHGHLSLPDRVVLYLLGLSSLFWLGSLMPRGATVGQLRVRSDGYQLLHTPRFTTEVVRAVIAQTLLHRVEMLWEEGRREEAWQRLGLLQSYHPTEAGFSNAEGFYLNEQGDHAAAAESYGRILQRDGLPKVARGVLLAYRFGSLARAGKLEEAKRCSDEALYEQTSAERRRVLDALATEVLAYELTAFLPDADRWSEEALALAPATLTLQGTRGSVLVELGRLEEGEALLRTVWEQSASETDAAICAFYLGKAARLRGQRRQVHRWLKRAKTFAPFVGKWLAARIASEWASLPLTHPASS